MASALTPAKVMAGESRLRLTTRAPWSTTHLIPAPTGSADSHQGGGNHRRDSCRGDEPVVSRSRHRDTSPPGEPTSRNLPQQARGISPDCRQSAIAGTVKPNTGGQ